MAESMKLLVKMLTGREIEVEVEKTGKVEDVKDYIYRNTGEAGRKAYYIKDTTSSYTSPFSWLFYNPQVFDGQNMPWVPQDLFLE